MRCGYTICGAWSGNVSTCLGDGKDVYIYSVPNCIHECTEIRRTTFTLFMKCGYNFSVLLSVGMSACLGDGETL